MPIYEYACARCGHDWEQLQKFDDPPPSACPSCAGDEVDKRVSMTSFQLKGDGWYVTDFKDGSKRKSGDATKADAGAGHDKAASAKDASASAGGSEGGATSAGSAAGTGTDTTGGKSGGGKSGGGGSGTSSASGAAATP